MIYKFEIVCNRTYFKSVFKTKYFQSSVQIDIWKIEYKQLNEKNNHA